MTIRVGADVPEGNGIKRLWSLEFDEQVPQAFCFIQEIPRPVQEKELLPQTLRREDCWKPRKAL